MIRKLALFGGAAVLAFAMFVPAAAAGGPPPIDASQYTVQCDTMLKGQVKFKPSLTLGGTEAGKVQIKGTVTGCVATAPDPINDPPLTVVSGKVKGNLTTTTNDCLSLLGPSTATGSITIKWKTAEKTTKETKSTVIDVAMGDISGGTANPFSDAATYGLFGVSGTTQTGAFGGADNGASSFTNAVTIEGVTSLGAQCDPGNKKGLKGVGLGSTELFLG